MQYRTLVLGMVVALLLFIPASAVAGSYVGLYADAQATQPCTNVPPSTVKTLYVIARVDGILSSGLTGAEFRIEFENPTGWLASYTAPATASAAIGDPIDMDPDPDEGGGVDLAFPSCQSPLNGMVSLGTISVFNEAGSSTAVNIKRHSHPRNTYYSCPLFTICDSTFAKVCMWGGQAASCSLAVSKGRMVDNDPTAFQLTLNGLIAEPPPPDSAFTETIAMQPGNELWAVGAPVQGPLVICHFDGRNLSLGGVVLLEVSAPEYTNQQLTDMYSRIPRVATLLNEGMTVRCAAAIYKEEVEALLNQACAAYHSGGDEAMRQVIEASPLVQQVDGVRNGRTRFIYREPGATWRGFSCNEEEATLPLPSRYRMARGTVETLRAFLEQAKHPCLIAATGTTLSIFHGERATQARAQLEHVYATGSVRDSPAGPIPRATLEGQVHLRAERQQER